MVLSHNCAGERMAGYIDGVSKTIFGDIPKEELLIDFEYNVMNYRERGYGQIPYTGFSSDYVYRETKRALDGAAGTKTRIWPGIDIDIPTGKNQSKSTPQGTKDAVLAAFKAGAPGRPRAREISGVKLSNFSRAWQT